MKRRLALCLWLALTGPVSAAPGGEAAILGTIPSYPGASRPLPQWESSELAIALTRDKPEAVIAYYIDRLAGSGWQPPEGLEAEAYASALAKEPVWLTFTKAGAGRLDIQVTQGRHPDTQELLTLIYYQSRFKH